MNLNKAHNTSFHPLFLKGHLFSLYPTDTCQDCNLLLQAPFTAWSCHMYLFLNPLEVSEHVLNRPNSEHYVVAAVQYCRAQFTCSSVCAARGKLMKLLNWLGGITVVVVVLYLVQVNDEPFQSSSAPLSAICISSLVCGGELMTDLCIFEGNRIWGNFNFQGQS